MYVLIFSFESNASVPGDNFRHLQHLICQYVRCVSKFLAFLKRFESKIFSV